MRVALSSPGPSLALTSPIDAGIMKDGTWEGRRNDEAVARCMFENHPAHCRLLHCMGRPRRRWRGRRSQQELPAERRSLREILDGLGRRWRLWFVNREVGRMKSFYCLSIWQRQRNQIRLTTCCVFAVKKRRKESSWSNPAMGRLEGPRGIRCPTISPPSSAMRKKP